MPSLRPDHFAVDEAWIAFRLNRAPIYTKEEGLFNCFVLIDAATGFILAGELVSVDEPEPTQLDAKRLLNSAWEHNKTFPVKLFVPAQHFEKGLSVEAAREGISVVSVDESELLEFTEEPRDAYEENLG